MYPVDLVGGNVFAYPFSLEICVIVFLMSCVCLISRVSELKYSSKQELLISLSEAFSGGPSPPLFKNKTWLSLIIPIYEWSDAAKKGLFSVMGSQTAITCSVTLDRLIILVCVMFWGQKVLGTPCSA